MAKAKKTDAVQDEGDGSAIDIGDSASLLYKDRSGQHLGGSAYSEGKANFAAITDAARASVQTTETPAE